jgi:kinesin family protein 23
VSNPRHRRSQSAGAEVWLDHRPENVVELSTIMQPLMKRRKSVARLKDAKDVVKAKTSKYCLMTQEQDSSGELETRLYKVCATLTTQHLVKVRILSPRPSIGSTCGMKLKWN